MKNYKPDVTTKFVSPTGEVSHVRAMSIKGAGNAIVVMARKSNSGCMFFCLSHTVTGASILGGQLLSSSRIAATLARKFWASLNKKEKEIWQKSADPAAIVDATPKASREMLREKVLSDGSRRAKVRANQDGAK